MSENQSEESLVRKSIAVVAGPRGWGDTRESWLAIVPRKVPTVTFRTVKALWYGEIDDNEHWAAREIRRAAELIEARKETAALAAKYQKIIGGLSAVGDTNLYREEIDRLERLVSRLGAADSTGA